MSGTKRVLLSVLTVGTAQILLKYGLNKIGAISYSLPNLGSTLLSLATSPFVVIAFFLFGLSSILWLLAISEAELSYAYPILGLGYAIVSFFSWLVFDEAMSSIRVMGILTIVAGVFLLSRGAK